MRQSGIMGLAVVVGTTAGLLGASAAWSKDITLVMAAPDWPPTRFMQEEADRSYQAPSGNNVKLAIDFIPWPSFYERVAASLTSGEQKYNMLVTDSQWLGSFIEGGYYLSLNDYIEADPELQAIMKDLHPALVSAYSTYPHIPAADLQEYPDPNATYYGFPQMPDTYVTWYREDLFCNEKERANFEQAYGKPLPCSYEEWEDVDWETFGQIGEFFRRAKGEELGDGTADDDFYGIAYQAGKGYDFSTMSINAFIWQYGGGIWDEIEGAGRAGLGRGELGPEAVEAFEHYLNLLQYMPPAYQTGQMDIFVRSRSCSCRARSRRSSTGWASASRCWTRRPRRCTTSRRSRWRPGTQGRRLDHRTGQHRRPAVRADHLETTRSNEAALEVVKWWRIPRTAEEVRRKRRPVRPAQRHGRSRVQFGPPLEPGAQRDARLAA